MEGRALYDLGDFLDDYATDRALRNDLGLLFLVTLDAEGPVWIEAVPLKLEYCHTRLAEGRDAAWIRRRFRRACAEFGTEVVAADGRLLIEPRAGRGTAADNLNQRPRARSWMTASCPRTAA